MKRAALVLVLIAAIVAGSQYVAVASGASLDQVASSIVTSWIDFKLSDAETVLDAVLAFSDGDCEEGVLLMSGLALRSISGLLVPGMAIFWADAIVQHVGGVENGIGQAQDEAFSYLLSRYGIQEILCGAGREIGEALDLSSSMSPFERLGASTSAVVGGFQAVSEDLREALAEALDAVITDAAEDPATYAPTSLGLQFGLSAEVEDFSSDVFLTSTWSRSSPSVYVDNANGWLIIPSIGSVKGFAEREVSDSLPLTITARMRLVSGGRDYKLPKLELYFSDENFISVTFLTDVNPSDSHGGWLFDGWTFVNTLGPTAENQWLTVRMVIRRDGGDLYAKRDSEDEFQHIASRDWEIGGSPARVRLMQTWDATCHIDYLSISKAGCEGAEATAEVSNEEPEVETENALEIGPPFVAAWDSALLDVAGILEWGDTSNSYALSNGRLRNNIDLRVALAGSVQALVVSSLSQEFTPVTSGPHGVSWVFDWNGSASARTVSWPAPTARVSIQGAAVISVVDNESGDIIVQDVVPLLTVFDPEPAEVAATGALFAAQTALDLGEAVAELVGAVKWLGYIATIADIARFLGSEVLQRGEEEAIHEIERVWLQEGRNYRLSLLALTGAQCDAFGDAGAFADFDLQLLLHEVRISW